MPAQPNQSLHHALAVLQAVSASPAPVGSRDLARRLGMEHTRVNRLLGTLADLGLTARTPERTYVPGPGVHVLAAMAMQGSGLVQAAVPVLRRELADCFMVALGVRWRDQVCYLLHGPPAAPLEDTLAGHELFPAERSSIGRILHACSGGADPQAAADRARGWAWAEHPEFGGGSLAVAVGDPALAGLAAISRTVLPAAAQAALAARLRTAADAIAADLGERQRRPPRRRVG